MQWIHFERESRWLNLKKRSLNTRSIDMWFQASGEVASRYQTTQDIPLTAMEEGLLPGMEKNLLPAMEEGLLPAMGSVGWPTTTASRQLPGRREYPAVRKDGYRYVGTRTRQDWGPVSSTSPHCGKSLFYSITLMLVVLLVLLCAIVLMTTSSLPWASIFSTVTH